METDSGLSSAYQAFLEAEKAKAGGSGQATSRTGASFPSTHYDKTKEGQRRAANGQKQEEREGEISFSPSPPTKGTNEPEEKKEGSGEREDEGGGVAKSSLVPRGLPIEAKRFLVESFATFQTLKYMRDELKLRWGLSIDERTLRSYDVGDRRCKVGSKLVALYHEVRKAYVEGASQMAVAHQAHRLRLIGTIVEKATLSKDYNAALKGIELAAKEMGGVLEGKTTITHQGTVGHVHLNVEDARAELAMRLQGIVDGGTLLPSAPPTQAQDAVATPTPSTPQAVEGEG